MKALLLHCAGAYVFDLSNALGVTADTTQAENAARLTAYFVPNGAASTKRMFFGRQASSQARRWILFTLAYCSWQEIELTTTCRWRLIPKIYKSAQTTSCAKKGLGDDAVMLDKLLWYGRKRETASSQIEAILVPAAAPSVHAVRPSTHRSAGRPGSRSAGEYERVPASKPRQHLAMSLLRFHVRAVGAHSTTEMLAQLGTSSAESTAN